MQEMTISANGQSAFITLYGTTSKVRVCYAAGAAGTLTPQESRVEGEEIAVTLPDGSTTIVKSEVFLVRGSGLLSFVGSGVSGNIKVTMEKIDG